MGTLKQHVEINSNRTNVTQTYQGSGDINASLKVQIKRITASNPSAQYTIVNRRVNIYSNGELVDSYTQKYIIKK